MAAAEGIFYWDASAILSALARDSHTDDAHRRLASGSHHLVSSLAHAEVMAVLARIEREGRAPADEISLARRALGSGPWRRLGGVPRPETTEELSLRHPLRGADLWHLAMAISVRSELPELRMLTYDTRLGEGAAKEGLQTAPPELGGK
jgi:predicted nucleic acid-binding protein